MSEQTSLQLPRKAVRLLEESERRNRSPRTENFAIIVRELARARLSPQEFQDLLDPPEPTPPPEPEDLARPRENH